MCSDSECSDQTHIAAIDAMYNSVICALGTAGNVFMQEMHIQKRYATIPGWKEFCQDAHSQACNAFLWWARSGRPRSGVIFQTMLQTRAAFKQTLRHCRRSDSRRHADNLARKLLTKDSRKFWKEIKIITGQDRAPLAASIGPATSPTAIAELWRGHYQGILNSTPSSPMADEIRDSLRSCSSFGHTFQTSDIKRAVDDMKFGKANGLDGLASEHFKYASEKLYVLLCICFNAMLLHSHVPTEFSNTILVPIIKDKKSNITDPDNYRPIAIATVASKIFENIILHYIKDCLYTSDNQFSYKANSSTDMAVFTLKAVIDYYITSSSPVYLCFLDASKAFDRVNYWCLFKKLYNRNVPVVYIRFLIAWYCTQQFFVRWGNVLSVPFSASNGVRQGGILSPLLFNLYMDDISNTLNCSRQGCIINGVPSESYNVC